MTGGWRRVAIACAAVSAVALMLAPTASGAGLRAGAGRADITPPTGYYMMGWVRSDAKVIGQHTRLFARAIVLKRGGQKLALVAADLNAIPGGLVQDATELLEGRGFSERNVVVSGSHTHAAPTGFYNFGTYNTVFPTSGTLTEFQIADTAADPQLYGFMVRQLAAAIRRADDDIARAAAGWGSGELLGLTENRSIEAHLANHGVIREFGEGAVGDDPQGYRHTIDPAVDVLRVDKLRRGGRRVPIGMWSAFANHGTVNKHTFRYYNADHHGSATRVVERRIRRREHVPRGQEVVNAYGNTDEGDISSGLDRGGPAAADAVGRFEARAMLDAWSDARQRMSRRPSLGSRWTRICFCGQRTEGGRVDSEASIGLPLFTGSEEGRGPLFDETGVPFEGRRNPVNQGPQGHKIQAFRDVGGGTPNAVPLSALRIGDRVLVTVPGEMTAEMGRRVRAAVLRAAAGAEVAGVVISGLANEYVQYFTTPEEFDRQHYEGGSTLYGVFSSNLIRASLSELSERLVSGRPPPEPYEFDPTNGVVANDTPFDSGATSGSPVSQPGPARRLERAEFRWLGGPRGFDRPLERPFVRIQRRAGGEWRHVTDDLGLQILWSVDRDGGYTARWEIPRGTRPGRHRFRITANGYELASAPFRVGRSAALRPRVVDSAPGRATVTLDYPAPVAEQDITFRPAHARGGRVAFRVDGRRRLVEKRRGSRFTVRGSPTSRVTIPAGAARDRHGNRNGEPVSFTL